jgi:SAM-dependent methyltransferase
VTDDRIHAAAATGYQRGAADYEKGRPSYPADAVAAIVDGCDISAASVVVDVGAGTGKFTRLLERTGATVIAVEPVAAMREVLATRSPGLRVLDGTAEALPLADGSADVVTIAQAFHWFDHAAALDEIARVLRPGGALALIWNTRDVRVPWLARINSLMDALAGDGPRFRSTDRRWRVALDDHAQLGPLSEAAFENPVPGVDAETIRARVASTSYVSALPDHEREAVLAEVEAILAEGPLADEGPVFADHYVTEAYWCRRR